MADLVFDGVAAPASPSGPSDTVAFRVRSWHKHPADHGAPALTVRLAPGLTPREGDVWRVYAHLTDHGLAASRCSGTQVLTSAAGDSPVALPGTGFTGALAAATVAAGLRRKRRRAGWLRPALG